MKEDFLHCVWQHQYFEKANLATAEQEAVQVLKTGFLNKNAGPDFMAAQVKIGEVTWNGSVEVHLKASDWLRHQHEQDARYDQIILHVVWENDQTLRRMDGSLIPVIELKNRVADALLQIYLHLKREKTTIPCSPFLAEVPVLPKIHMLDRVLPERLEQKAAQINQRLESTNNNWEEVTYQALMTNFGFKINKEPFSRLSKILPFAILRRHQGQLLQTEALLIGQAGFLAEPLCQDDYLLKLRKEYLFLHRKFSLAPALTTSDWNFLRLRPGNFPTVRLAQLAAFLYSKEHLFSALLDLDTIPQFMNFFRADVGSYWRTHYLPGRQTKKEQKGMGKDSILNILINTVIPLLFAYARYLDNQALIDKALGLLESIQAEQNSITSIFEQLRFDNRTAMDSQALLQLYQGYCAPRNCLNCSIGHKILKSYHSSP